MARIGPNQDINDPTTIINLAYQYQQQSDNLGNLLAQFNAQNPNISGSPIIDTSIPFKMIDGSTQLLYSRDIDYNEGYIYNNNLVSNAITTTYINLAERFRDYWETLNNILDQLNNYSSVLQDDIEPEEPFSIIGGPGLHVVLFHQFIIGYTLETRLEYGSLGGIAHSGELYSHLPSGSLSLPTWSGIGPTNYNQSTYLQLSNELSKIEGQVSTSGIIWDTIYWYDKWLSAFDIDTDAAPRSIGISFGQLMNSYFSPYPTNDQQYVQFYNDGSDIMNISLSVNISGTFIGYGQAYYASWAEINDINSYPNPFNGAHFLLSSYVYQSEFGGSEFGGSITLSHNRIVEISPGKSAFIGCSAGIATPIGTFPGLISANISLVLNDQTLTYSIYE